MVDRMRRIKDRASRLYSEGKLKEALALYEQAVEADPTALGLQIKVGDIHRRMGQGDRSIAAYEPVARRYAEDGLLLKAIAVCKLILLVDPDHTATQGMLADLYVRRRSGAQAGPDVPALAVVDVNESIAGQWPSGVRLVDFPESDSVMASWPTSQPLDAEAAGTVLPLVQGEPDGEDFDIDVAEPVLEPGTELSQLFPDPNGIGVDAVVDPAALSEVDLPSTGDDRAMFPLFSDLPKRAFIELLVRMRMHDLRRGETVIQEGDDGDSFYVVASGLLSVTRRGSQGQDVRLAQLGEGAFFGEMALLQDGVRTATVRVAEDAQVFEVSRELLEELVAQYPTVATAVKNFYRQRLLATAMATHPLFGELPREERRELMGQFKSRSFAPGESILQQGKKGNGLYLLLHGRVKVSREKEDGQPVHLAHLGSGDVFGEMSLLTGEPTNATVTAVDDAFVLRLSKKRFDELMAESGPVSEMIGRLREERSLQNEKILARQLDARGALVV